MKFDKSVYECALECHAQFRRDLIVSKFDIAGDSLGFVVTHACENADRDKMIVKCVVCSDFIFDILLNFYGTNIIEFHPGWWSDQRTYWFYMHRDSTLDPHSIVILLDRLNG